MASRVNVRATTAWSYSTSRGPKQAGQTYDRPMGAPAPQLRQRMPRIRPAAIVDPGVVSADAAVVGMVSIAMVVLREAGRASGPGVRATVGGKGGSEGRSLISQGVLPGLGTLPNRR